MQRKGMLIIVSGPSGVGKGTICAELRRPQSSDTRIHIDDHARAPQW